MGEEIQAAALEALKSNELGRRRSRATNFPNYVVSTCHVHLFQPYPPLLERVFSSEPERAMEVALLHLKGFHFIRVYCIVNCSSSVSPPRAASHAVRIHWTPYIWRPSFKASSRLPGLLLESYGALAASFMRCSESADPSLATSILSLFLGLALSVGLPLS